mgnify:CR=1 FL=1
MKILKIINTVYDKIIVVVFIILLLLSLYFIYDSWYVRYISSGNSYNVYKPTLDNLDSYKDLSDECIGWITIDDTKIDYPIMQADDNSKYLNTDPYGEYSLAGSIFLDYKNNKNFTDPYNLIYGHHMSDYKMFGELDKFKFEEFFNSHRTGTLIIDNKQYKLDIFALVETDANVKPLFDPTNYTNQLELIKNSNVYYYEPKNKNIIIALSTCKEPSTTVRTMLICSLIKD